MSQELRRADMPGPPPSRTSARSRMRKDVVIETLKVTDGSKVVPPKLEVENPHPVTVMLFDSLLKSAQAKYYEQSDWSYAVFALSFADRLLKSGRPSGPMLATVHSMMGDLLVSEGARRRFRIEIERKEPEESKELDIATLFKQRLSQG